MKKENALQILGIAVFLIVTLLTYGVVNPANTTSPQGMDKSKVASATVNATANTTNTTEDSTVRLANNYHVMAAISAGAVVAIVIVFLVGFW